MARPPELAYLAAAGIQRGEPSVIVYPDPPLGETERRLLANAWPDMQIRTMMEWQADTAP